MVGKKADMPQRGSAAAAASLRRRRTAARRDASSMLQFYTNDAPGIKISPIIVVVMSIVFIAVVSLMHVFGKLYR